GGEARPLVRGRQGARVRERGARRGRAGVRRAVRILLVNWNDRENPHAGGAEIHLHEIFGRLAGWGHTVDLVASGWPGGAAQTVLDAMRVHRSGGRHSFALRARAVVGRLLHTRSYDILVEDINKLPLYLTQLTELPFCVIVPHLFGATAFAEASWPIAAVVWAAERLARALSQVDAVRFLGFVPDAEKRRLLRRAWAVVLPSQKEGWGISNVEAAACGTPALASDSPGLRESVRHGETGFLVPHGDERALADRMLALAAEPGDHRSALALAVARVRRQLGKAAPKRRRVAAARRAVGREPR